MMMVDDDGDGDRQIRKPVKLPEDSNGKQPLKEYLMHFEGGAIVNGWNEKQKATFLAASPRDKRRQLFSGLSDVEYRPTIVFQRGMYFSFHLSHVILGLYNLTTFCSCKILKILKCLKAIKYFSCNQ